MRLWIAVCLVVGCSKPAPSVEEFGEPIGIEISGASWVVAVAPEKGHEITAASVPELATAFAGAKSCTVDKLASLNAAVKDGKISAPADPKMDAASACVARAIDGKPIKTIAPTKMLVQLAPKAAE